MCTTSVLTCNCAVQVLCTFTPSCCQLQEKEVRTQQPGTVFYHLRLSYWMESACCYYYLVLMDYIFCIAVEAKEEDQVDCFDCWKDFFVVITGKCLLIISFLVLYEFCWKLNWLFCQWFCFGLRHVKSIMLLLYSMT